MDGNPLVWWTLIVKWLVEILHHNGLSHLSRSSLITYLPYAPSPVHIHSRPPARRIRPKLLITVVAVVSSANVMYVENEIFHFPLESPPALLLFNWISLTITPPQHVLWKEQFYMQSPLPTGPPQDVRREQQFFGSVSLPTCIFFFWFFRLFGRCLIIEKKQRSAARHSLVTVLLFLLATSWSLQSDCTGTLLICAIVNNCQMMMTQRRREAQQKLA